LRARGLPGLRNVTSSPSTPFQWLIEHDFSQ
jgi:hypothetical protein